MIEVTTRLAELDNKSKEELLDLARELGLEDGSSLIGLRKQDLELRLLQAYAERQGYLLASGILDITNEGFGFLRSQGSRQSHGDVYVSQTQIRRFGLRTGDQVTGQVRAPKDGERYHGLIRVEAINGVDPEVSKGRPFFDRLTPIFPEQMIRLETVPQNLSNRVIDLVAPIGRGQRGLIVSPPKAGKTMLLKSIANGITANYKEIFLMVALTGERPEEVTDVQRSVDGEVYSSTFDESGGGPLPGGGASAGAGQAPGGGGRRRGDPARQPDPPNPGLQPGHAHQRAHPLGRH